MSQFMCENILRLHGSPHDVLNFIKENHGDERDFVLDFSKSVPLSTRNDGTIIFTADACRSKWGTKWNLSKSSVNLVIESDDMVSYQFYTPFCPPNLWFYKIGFKYEKIQFSLKFQEIVNNIAGEYICWGKKLYRRECEFNSRYGWGLRYIYCDKCQDEEILDIQKDYYEFVFKSKHLKNYKCCLRCSRLKRNRLLKKWINFKLYNTCGSRMRHLTVKVPKEICQEISSFVIGMK